MFITQGLKAVRMDDIAQELSMSKRTLYELFGDKEELLYQSIRHYSTRNHERRKRQMATLDNDLEIMILCLRDMIAHAPIASRLRRNMQRFYPSVHKRLEADSNINSMEHLRGWIKKCVDSGYFTQTSDCDFVAKMLNDSVQGLLVTNQDESRDSVEIISLMSYAIVIFIRGLCTAKGMEVVDNNFQKYFGNIPSPDTL